MKPPLALGFFLPAERRSNVAVIEDFYQENMGNYCERCRQYDNVDDRRLIKLAKGSNIMFICRECVRGYTDILKSKVLVPQRAWAMPRVDLLQWIDPNGHASAPGADDLRKSLTIWDQEMIEAGKELMKLNIDRNDYYLEMRKLNRDLIKTIESFLTKVRR